jgi:hypothetical protein
MAEEPKKPPMSEIEPFHLDLTFPEPSALFSFALKPLDEIKNDAVIILDNNALLLPFRTAPAKLKAIRSAYEKLIAQKKLVVPAQVAREFAATRSGVLATLYDQISGAQSRDIEGMAHYPLLSELAEFEDLKRIEDDLLSALAKRKKALAKLADRVRLWRWNDPVSTMYRELFVRDVIVPLAAKQDELQQEMVRKTANRMPLLGVAQDVVQAVRAEESAMLMPPGAGKEERAKQITLIVYHWFIRQEGVQV